MTVPVAAFFIYLIARLQHTIRLDRPVKAYDRWIARIPDT